MTQDEFLNEYISKNHRISEGYAYAIQASWYRQFERFLQNPSGVDVTRFNKIQNSQIAEGTIDMSVSLKQYSLPPYQQINYSHVYGLKPDAKFQTDFYIVSIDVWHFFKLYYGSDYDVIVFVTQQHPQMNNYLICDNFEEGLCICREIINVLFVIVFPRNISVMQAILTPISPWMDLIKFRAFLFAMHNFGIDAIKFINEGFIYFNNKKCPSKEIENFMTLAQTRISKLLWHVKTCQCKTQRRRLKLTEKSKNWNKIYITNKNSQKYQKNSK